MHQPILRDPLKRPRTGTDVPGRDRSRRNRSDHGRRPRIRFIGDADDPTPRAERRRGRFLAVQAAFTLIAVALLAVEWAQREGTPWLVAAAIVLLLLALAASAARYLFLRG
jgi:hypothetical protein